MKRLPGILVYFPFSLVKVPFGKLRVNWSFAEVFYLLFCLAIPAIGTASIDAGDGEA